MRREVLSDGLRVLTFERPDTPLVALKLFLKVGSRHDGARPGISHFVEHMLFRRDWPGGDSAFRRIEAVGGEINAVTHREYTALQAVVLARDVARVFQAFREALAPLDLTGEGVAQEREILLHEIGRAGDTQAVVWDLFLQALWGEDDPLARPVYGTAGSVRAITAEDLRAHFRRYLVPTQMVLAVAGGIRHDEVVELARRELSWPAGEAGGAEGRPLARGAGRLGLDKDLQATHLVVGVETTGMKDPRRSAVKVMDIVLGKGAHSRLHGRLREELGVVYQATSVAMAYEDRGYLCAYTSCAPRHVPMVVEVILDELDRLRRTPIGEEELRDAQAHYEGSLARHFETVLSLAGIIGVEELLHRVEPFDESIARVRRVSAAEIQTVAGELLDLDRVAVAHIGRTNGSVS